MKSWLDGVLVTDIIFQRVENDREVVINEMNGSGSIVPNPHFFIFNASAITMDLSVDVSFVAVKDVAAALLTQPAVETMFIKAEVSQLHVTVRATVDTKGIPQLQLDLDTARLIALGVEDSVIAGMREAGTASIPFDIGKELKDLLPPGTNKVLNTGITLDKAGAIVLRFEFANTGGQSVPSRANDWRNFFSPDFRANLENDDWSMDLDGEAVAAMMAGMVKLQDEKPIDFDPSMRSGYIGDATPRAVLTQNGRIVNACSGNDVKFDLFVNFDFTVPSDNLLRGSLSLDMDLDNWRPCQMRRSDGHQPPGDRHHRVRQRPGEHRDRDYRLLSDAACGGPRGGFAVRGVDRDLRRQSPGRPPQG